ncbi:WXG100 family type VII secretion target [Gordonia sp. CPCC 205515]|uniref:WXG100 family type VII secretion target n=1 Tax=Gordonia sp. CPCC 205515 TaxID=3140791 RepID=UPI003AF3A500
MTDEFRVDLDELDSVVQRLTQFDKLIGEQLTHIDQLVTNLHGSWSGLAATAHAEAHRTWAAGAKTFHDGVTEMGTVAKNAHTHYTRAQSVNRRMLG